MNIPFRLGCKARECGWAAWRAHPGGKYIQIIANFINFSILCVKYPDVLDAYDDGPRHEGEEEGAKAPGVDDQVADENSKQI